MLELRTLGTIDLRGEDGRSLPSVLVHPKRVALLAFLCASHPEGLHRRATLAALLWPEMDDAHAFRAGRLRGAAAIARVRTALSADAAWT